MLERHVHDLARRVLADPQDGPGWAELARAAPRLGQVPPDLRTDELLGPLYRRLARQPSQRELRQLVAFLLGLARPRADEVPGPFWSASGRLAEDAEGAPVDAETGLWVRARRRRDGAALVLVPAGVAILGSNDGFPGHQPARRVHVEGFYVDRTPVTVAQWEAFLAAGEGAREPLSWPEQRRFPDHPVVGVTWQDAQAYGDWVGGRLPSEDEWEKAARGPDARPYPWGSEAPSELHANFAGPTPRARGRRKEWWRAFASVHTYPAGASPFGALDMAGNAGEWCEDLAHDLATTASQAEGRVVRGGRHSRSRHQLYCWSRERAAPGRRNRGVGFRLVVPLDVRDRHHPRHPGVELEPVADEELPFEARAFPDPAAESALLDGPGFPFLPSLLRLLGVPGGEEPGDP